MSIISRVAVHEFTYQALDVGFDRGGFDFVGAPGRRLAVTKFAIVIETKDGSRGEYVGLWGATRASLGQVLTLAPHLIGRDALQRELIYDEFKRALRQYDHMGYGHIDIALWDLFGKRVGLPISTLLGGWRTRYPRTPALCMAIVTGRCRGQRIMLISPSTAIPLDTALSRCMAGTRAMSRRRWKAYAYWANGSATG